MAAKKNHKTAFEEAQDREPERGLVREFVEFLANERAWWLAPIILALVVMAGFIALSMTGVAPFIYTLF